MGIKQTKAEYQDAVTGFTALRKFLALLGGGGGSGSLKDQIMPVFEKLLKSRSKLVRDVSAAKVREILDQEALMFLALEGEKVDQGKREAAVQYLSTDPAGYIRALTKRISKEIETLPVDSKLGQLSDEY